ncbi:MAG: class I adenylate-forming enzyme family protein [Halodesulfurarchaeum sp.]
MTLDIRTRADHYPSRQAAIDHSSKERWTYGRLAEEADRSAGRLQAMGVGPDDTVAVLSRNRLDLLSLFFGARSIGVTVAPISYRLPEDAIDSLLDRIDPNVVLAETHFEETIDALGIEWSGFDEFESIAPQSPPDVDPAEEPLYLHTGGTTGTPKVVVISDRQLEWNAITEVAAWGLGRESISPILLPMFHTGGWTLLTIPTLYVGGTVVLQREFDPGGALEMIETYGATQVFGVAAIFDAIRQTERFAETDLSSVAWMMSGGGPTPEDIAETYRDRGVPFVRGYGLTEGGPNNLYMDPERDVSKPGSAGRPFPDVEARIVSDGDPVGPNTVGELEFRGPVTADRYLETDDGTFEGEWISTGDLARRDEDGDYFIVGRTDNMFVSGGENVYPEAIESVLEDHPDVEAVGVIGIPHDRWGTVPKAIVEGEGDPADLRSFAGDTLADYEVPRDFEFVDELPRSGPGKLDREALERRFGR